VTTQTLPPQDATKDRRLDIGGLSGIFAMAAAAAGAVGQWLRHIVSPDAQPSAELIVAIAATTLFTVAAAAVATALIARIFTVAGGFTSGFWPAMAILLQDYALHLAVWTVLWGAPFATAMIVGVVVTPYIGKIFAFVAAIVAAVLLLLLFRRFLSDDIWKVLANFGPAPRIGNLRMMLLLFFLLVPARIHVDHCYIFDVAIPATSVSRRDPLEVHAHVAGRILNHARLRVELTPVATAKPIRIQRFATEEPGNYIALLDLSRVPEGLYRARVFFAAAPRFWLAPWFYDAGIQRTIVVRVRS
jgi:hypothetical protein